MFTRRDLYAIRRLRDQTSTQQAKGLFCTRRTYTRDWAKFSGRRGAVETKPIRIDQAASDLGEPTLLRVLVLPFCSNSCSARIQSSTSLPGAP